MPEAGRSATQMQENLLEIAALIDALLDAAPGQRAARIAEMSRGDPARQAMLEALLAECEREPTLLGQPAAERFATLFEEDVASFPVALADRYLVRKELARGGMATVYLAHDVRHARDVAVKVLHPLVAAALGAERFLREIEIASRLHYPLIVPLYDSGESGGTLYYVMPYEEGQSLRDRMTRDDGRLPLGEVVTILRDVCDALAHAHERGIVHRDIKPDNILLSGRHAMVTDFGVAKAVADPSTQSTLTASGVAIGTPAYMAPEQIAADPRIDHRADIYAVGAMGYELLTGRPPFSGNAQQRLTAHLTHSPEPIATYRRDVPKPLAELVMKCLEKKPADRWQTSNELVQRLGGLASMLRTV